MEDIPSDAPDFDFGTIAHVLVEELQRQRSASFVLGLHGPWGSGKTTLMNALRSKLPPSTLVIDFNAWKYQDREALWRALILRVVDVIRTEIGGDAEAAELERSLYESFTVVEKGTLQVNWTAAVSEVLITSMSLAAFGPVGGVVKGAGDAIARWFRATDPAKDEDVAKRVERVSSILQRSSTERAVRQVRSIEQFLALFRNLVARIGADRRICVLIDDLDRCLPDEALGIFEAIKLFLDAPECVFVVAVDRSVIRSGLELRYPVTGDQLRPPTVHADEYIEKTISLSFDLPALSQEDSASLLEPDRAAAFLSSEQISIIVDVLGSNPRRLKRFRMLLAVWSRIAATSPFRTAHAFSPERAGDRDLFVKLALIGYMDSELFGQARHDDQLLPRLQTVSNSIGDSFATGEGRKAIADGTATELPSVRRAALDAALWRALRPGPNLADCPELKQALGWFRSVTAPEPAAGV